MTGDSVTRNSSNASLAEPALVESTFDSGKARPSDFALFFQKFLSKGLAISSAVPSSRSLVEAVLGHVDFTRPSTIIELGAGTGPITSEILDLLRPHHRFVAVEKDPDFCEVLRRRFPGTPLIQGDASQLSEPLARMGIHEVDYVLSGLPTPNLPTRSQVQLWRWLGRALRPSGVFVQITNAPLVYRRFYERLFRSVEYQMVWMNVPPGGVYRCAGPRRHLSRIGH